MNDKMPFYDMVLTGLTSIIRERLIGLSAEERHPHNDADASDDYIEDSRKALATYRRLREEFEDCHSGVIIPVKPMRGIVQGGDTTYDAMKIES